MDRQSKVSYGQMNHENLGKKITSNKAQVKTVTYLGTSILFIDRAQSLLAGLVSAPAEVLILAA
jgi:hypothetical protein